MIVILKETEKHTELLNRSKKKRDGIVEIGNKSDDPSLLPFMIVDNLEKLTPDFRAHGIQMSREEHEAAVSQYVDSLLAIGRQFEKKYELIDFGVWFGFVNDAHDACSMYLDDFYGADSLEDKIMSCESFARKLRELSARCSDPFGEVLLQNQITDLDAQIKIKNFWLTAWNDSHKRSNISFLLIVVTPGLLFVFSLISVFFLRWQEMYKALLGVLS